MMEPVPLTILIYEHITGGGMIGEELPESLAAEGAAMRRALAAEFAAASPGHRVIVTRDPRVSADDGPWDSVAIGSIDDLFPLARQADYTVPIAPETDGVLEALTRRLEKSGCSHLGSDAGAVALAADKDSMTRRFRRVGLETPRTKVLEPGAAPPEEWPFPAVVKPIDGAGSIDTFLVESRDEVNRLPGREGRRLIQEYIPGRPMSALFLVHPLAGPFLLTVGDQRIEQTQNRFHYLGGRLPAEEYVDADLLMRAVKAVRDLSGLVGVDFIFDFERRRTVFLELNPRPTTSIVGFLHAAPPGKLAEAWDFPCFQDDYEWHLSIEKACPDFRTTGPIDFSADGRISRHHDWK
ncbi:ATP-grasp domain-containing protein [Paludisphaera rhizosphaerae]|uniref:ATP-grasp domain-containing protein n=1 Tax=Paludisphaera rhizosphaerae TaxID=2711216 RepID=UPI0013EB9A53|nr:ATP-grasp domain-containing protein [Paludisphaera rhizosphaerae]